MIPKGLKLRGHFCLLCLHKLHKLPGLLLSLPNRVLHLCKHILLYLCLLHLRWRHLGHAASRRSHVWHRHTLRCRIKLRCTRRCSSSITRHRGHVITLWRCRLEVLLRLCGRRFGCGVRTRWILMRSSILEVVIMVFVAKWLL